MNPPSKTARHQRKEYLDYLNQQRNKNEGILNATNNNLESALDSLPLHDKNLIMKEKRVLNKWQARQQEWDKIEKNIEGRVCDKSKPELMMSRTDEYREKCESYDMHQMSIPIDEKHPSSAWLRSLREGGSRYVAVGNQFSGLYCEIGKEPTTAKIPKIIRKPRNQYSTFSNSTSMNSSNTTKEAQYRVPPKLSTFREFEPIQEDINHLQVTSQNLFDWAIQSTANYFSKIDNEEAEAARMFEESPSLYMLNNYPVIEFLTNTSLQFSSFSKQYVHASLTVVNRSTVPISYTLSYHEDLSEKIQNKHMNLLSITNNSNDNDVSEHVVNDAEGLVTARFICDSLDGELLPGQSKDINFTFYHEHLSTSYYEIYSFETTPIVDIQCINNRRYKKSPIYIDLQGKPLIEMAHIPSNIMKTTSTIHDINMNNYVTETIYTCINRVRTPLTPDMIITRKKKAYIDRNQYIIQAISSYTQLDLPMYYIPYFSMKRLDQWIHYFQLLLVTYQDNTQHVKQLYSDYQTILSQQNILYTLMNSDDFRELDETVIILNDLKAYKSNIEQVKNEIFPESTLDIFDCITEDEVRISWDYMMSRGINIIQLILQIQEFISFYQTTIIKMKETLKKYEEKQRKLKIKEEKIRLKELKKKKKLKKQQKLAAKGKTSSTISESDSDDEEDEDVNDESDKDDKEKDSDDDDQEESKVKPYIPITKAQQLSYEYYSRVISQMLTPILDTLHDSVTSTTTTNSKDITEGSTERCTESNMNNVSLKNMGMTTTLSSLVHTQLSAGFDHAGDWSIQCRERSKIPNTLKITPLSSPFLDKDTEEEWSKFIHTNPSTIDHTTTMNKDKNKKSTTNIATTTTGKKFIVQKGYTNEIQTYQYYHELYHMVKECIYECMTSALCQYDIQLHHSHLQEVAATRQYSINDFILYRTSQSMDVYPYVYLHVSYPIIFQSPIQNESNSWIFSYEQNTLLSTCMEMIRSGTQSFIFIDTEETTTDSNVSSNQEKESNHTNAVNGNTITSLFQKYYEIYNRTHKSNYTTTNDDGKKKKGKKESLKQFSYLTVTSLQDLNDNISTIENNKKKNNKNGNTITLILISATSNIPMQIQQTVTMSSLSSSNSSVWIETDMNTLLKTSSSSTYHHISANTSTSNMILSKTLKTFFNWISVLYALPSYVQYMISSSNELNEIQQLQKELLITLFPPLLPSSLSSTTNHDDDGSSEIATTVTPIVTPIVYTPIQVTYFMGGMITLEKLRILDEIIHMATTIVITGELSIPFIYAQTGFLLYYFESICRQLHHSCQQLIQKMNLRGVKLILPIDYILGDTVINREKVTLEYQQLNADMKDDGIEYTGDTTYLHLATYMTSSSTTNTHLSSGYPYDIGKETSLLLKEIYSISQVCIIWGPIGCYEVNGFQLGQSTLCSICKTSAVNKGPSTSLRAENTSSMTDISIPSTKKIPPYVWLIGETTVNVFSEQLISESVNGEHIYDSGIIHHITPDSSLFKQILGNAMNLSFDNIDKHSSSSSSSSISDKEIQLLLPIQYKHDIDEEEEEEEEEEDEEDSESDEDDNSDDDDSDL